MNGRHRPRQKCRGLIEANYVRTLYSATTANRPRQKCRGLIEASPISLQLSPRSQSIVPGRNAGASLKHVEAAPTHAKGRNRPRQKCRGLIEAEALL